MQITFFIRCLSQFFLLLLGASAALFFVGIFYEEPVFSLTHHYWASLVNILLICLFFTSIYVIQSEKEKEKLLEKAVLHEQEKSLSDASDLRTDLEKFKREVMHVLREIMKEGVSGLIEEKRRKKQVGYEEAKKELFRDLRKEFQSVLWMVEVLDDIKKSLKENKSS